MLILTKSVLAMMIGFLFAILIATIIIPFLKKIKAAQRLSIYLSNEHHSKVGTPTMGGLIFIIPTITIVTVFLILNKINFSYNVLIVLFGYMVFLYYWYW